MTKRLLFDFKKAPRCQSAFLFTQNSRLPNRACKKTDADRDDDARDESCPYAHGYGFAYSCNSEAYVTNQSFRNAVARTSSSL